MKSHITHLECAVSGRKFDHQNLQTFCTGEDGSKSPLYAKYGDLKHVDKKNLADRETTMWRYAELLPVLNPQNIVSLGEGMTPLFQLKNLSERLDLPHLYVKDESLNPTGSFKARGMSAAVSKMKELGVTQCIVPTAGNAGGALAAYCAKANIHATIVMPAHTPEAFKKECIQFGAELVLVDGLISDCGLKVQEMNRSQTYFDVSTMKEPYRLEGKKTMGFEIAEQLGWKLPEAIFYPTGGGTGLIGMWKAFQEMTEAGWINCKFPKMIAVQTENCMPVVKSFNHDNSPFQPVASVANGLAVPFPFAMKQILNVLEESGGFAIPVSEEELVVGAHEFARYEGLFVAPEGGALLPAVQKALAHGWIGRNDQVLLLNTGSGYKYETAARAIPLLFDTIS